MQTLALWIVVVVAGVVVGSYFVHGVWRAWGAWRISRAGPRPLNAVRHVLWRHPGDAASLDLSRGPGGADGRPVPPFRFVEEHFGGTNPCVSVVDARGRCWRAKWGDEVRSETFAVRLAWACGYFAETTYFVPEGTILGVSALQRASSCIDQECRFREARFELDDPGVKKLFEEHSWAWNDNPFVGSRELQGLKILTMLVSNWDTKDRRDVARGSNTAIFEHVVPGGREARYLITDWGGSMGSWGSNMITRARWEPAGFEAQTPQFVTGVAGEFVTFGYVGQRTEDVATGITVEDVRWLLATLARITDQQIDAALIASGANDDERERFGRALRQRIEQLERISAPAAEPAA
jgi:hypothetical protein